MNRLFFCLMSFLVTALLATACGGETVVRERVDSAETSASDTANVAESDAATEDSSTAEDDARDADAAETGEEPAEEPPAAGDDRADDAEATEPADASEDEPDDSTAVEEESNGGAIEEGLITDDQLTSLADDCTQGSDVACDILWQATELGTAEDEIALDCGGRGPRDGFFCTADIVAAPGESWFADDSPGIEAIGDDCRGGDMTACDFLYFRSAIDSPWEELGNTCADRIEVAFPDCRTVFGPTAE